MSVFTSQRKFIGTAGALCSYYEEESLGSSASVLGYYGIARDGVVFNNVAGKAAAQLLGLEGGQLTRAQHAEIHNGRWNGVQLVDGGYRAVYLKDREGRDLWVSEPGVKQKPYRIPEMVPMLNKNGDQVRDRKTGQVKWKKKMEPVFVNGYDVTFALDKSTAEFLIAHPEHTDVIRDCFLEAVNTAMRVAVEDHCNLVAKTVKAPAQVGARMTKTQGSATEMVRAEGLLWWSVFGNSARPTPKAIARGYDADCHPHAHVFLSSVAYMGDGKWQKVDGDELFKTAELRASVASTQFNRLLEERGIEVSYGDGDRKGRISSEIAGSNVDARDFFSTNSHRLWELQQKFENEYGRPPTKVEMDEIRQKTKADKSLVAKAADEMGNLDQVEKWRHALQEAGIDLTITDRGKPIERLSVDERQQLLYARLEAPEGVARDIETAAVFGPEVILPAVYRSAEGLGFDSDQLALIADHYRDTKLVLVREANDPAARLYTTETILAAEHDIAEAFELKSSQAGQAVPELDLIRAIRGQRVSLDPGQEELVRAIGSDSQLVHGVGRAGSGKSSALKPAVEALRASGVATEIVVASVAAKRAKETGESVDADRSASVESLSRAAAKGTWKPKKSTVVILDEAAMASTFDMAALLKAIGPAKLVTIGDSYQQSPIGAAGWYEREMEARPPVELKHVYRHSDWRDRDAYEMLRDGRAHEAIADLADRGRIFVADDPSQMVKLAQERYEHHREEGRAVDDIAIVHQGSNLTLDAYNRMVQRVRLDAGEISEWETFDVSEASSGRRWTLHAGDRIILNQGLYRGLSEPLMNGTTATVLRMSPEGACRLLVDGPERWQLTVDLKSEADLQPIAPAYATSTGKTQGSEYPVVLVNPGNPGIASLNSGYSGLTRGKDITEVLTDRETWGENPAKTLGQAWSVQAEKQQASEYLDIWEAEAINEVGFEFMLEPDEIEEEFDFSQDFTDPDEAKRQIREMRQEHGYEMGL